MLQCSGSTENFKRRTLLSPFADPSKRLSGPLQRQTHLMEQRRELQAKCSEVMTRAEKSLQRIHTNRNHRTINVAFSGGESGDLSTLPSRNPLLSNSLSSNSLSSSSGTFTISHHIHLQVQAWKISQPIKKFVRNRFISKMFA